jgi:hypothetical protein
MKKITMAEYQAIVAANVTGELTRDELEHIARAYNYSASTGNAITTAALINSARRVDSDPMFTN